MADVDDIELTAKLKEILEDWPLYRVYRYSGSTLYSLPSEISLFCDNAKCGKDQLWKKEGKTGADKGRWSTVEYRCRNCGNKIIRFFYFWYGREDNFGEFLKAGQYPPLQKEAPPRLAKKLDAVDHDLYRKALTSRNNSYGLGALAYLRRVIENRMNDLLDLLHEAAKNDDTAAAEVKKIEAVKKVGTFDDKISYASELLPKRLKPGGVNPIDKLHDLTSEGIHHRSEEECLDIFDRCKASFEYVFTELDVQIGDAKAYIETLKSLESKKSPTTAQPETKRA